MQLAYLTRMNGGAPLSAIEKSRPNRYFNRMIPVRPRVVALVTLG